MCHTPSILYLQHLYFYTHLIPSVLPLFFMLYLTRSVKNLNFEQHPQTFPASIKKKKKKSPFPPILYVFALSVLPTF